MMFEMSFDLQEEGALIRKVVEQALEEGFVTEDLADGGKAYGTAEVGAYLVDAILK
jgi:3-isopropylmalate dehydrogenase